MDLLFYACKFKYFPNHTDMYPFVHEMYYSFITDFANMLCLAVLDIVMLRLSNRCIS